MMNNTAIYIFNRIVRLSILFFILYLIFTNFGTFLMILGIIFVGIAFLIYNFKKKIKTSGFQFKFDETQFRNGQNFNFNDLNNFNNSNFNGFMHQEVMKFKKQKIFLDLHTLQQKKR
mgnify:CR=1 FL=1